MFTIPDESETVAVDLQLQRPIEIPRIVRAAGWLIGLGE